MSDGRVAVVLPQPANALLLNPIVRHTEGVLNELMGKLGDGSRLGDIASPDVTLASLKRMSPPLAATSETVQEYVELRNQLEQFARLWEQLETNAINTLTKSSDSANSVRSTVLEMTDRIRMILSRVPNNPGLLAQMDAVGAINNAVANASKEVLGEHARQARHARDFVAETLRYAPRRSYTPIPPGQIVQMQDMYYNLRESGFNHIETAAILSNINNESSLNTGAYNAKERAYGLCQWRDDRLANLKAFAAANGEDITSSRIQARFVMYEFQTTERKAFAAFRAARTPAEAARVFAARFERSAGLDTPERMANATRIAASLAPLADTVRPPTPSMKPNISLKA